MDPAKYYEHNPVPWNLKKKPHGGVPVNLRESPIQCPDWVPYFNVYKEQCDLRNNPIARALQNPPGQQLNYQINRNFERFSPIDEIKRELDQLPDQKSFGEQSQDNEENINNNDVPFWWDDPCVLTNKEHIYDIIPLPGMSLNRILNAFVRISVILFFLLYLVTGSLATIIIVIIAVIGTLYVHSQKNEITVEQIDRENEEHFVGLPSDVPSGVGTSNNPLDYAVYNTPAEFDDRLFKSVEENYGDMIMERNQVVSWDPFCQLSMTRGGFEHVLYGDNVKRHLFY